MLIYQRYIINSTILPVLLITLTLTGIVLIMQIFKLLHFLDRMVSLAHFFYLITLIIPSTLFIILPFATCIAVIYLYSRLTEDRQLLIFKNSGLSNIKLASPALLVCMAVTLFSYYLAGQLIPLSYKNLKVNLHYLKSNVTSSLIVEKTFNNLANCINLYAHRKLPNGTLEGLIIFDNRDHKNAILFAKAGVLTFYKEKLTLKLSAGSRQAHDANGNLTILDFDSLLMEMSQQKKPSITEDLSNKHIHEYYIHELLSPDDKLSLKKKDKLIIEGHQRLIWPFYNLLLSFLGLAIFLKQSYSKKPRTTTILLTTLAVGITTYLHFTTLNFAAKDFNFIYLCYANIIIVLIVSMQLYRQQTI